MIMLGLVAGLIVASFVALWNFKLEGIVIRRLFKESKGVISVFIDPREGTYEEREGLLRSLKREISLISPFGKVWNATTAKEYIDILFKLAVVVSILNGILYFILGTD